jgi:hypothetical protein
MNKKKPFPERLFQCFLDILKKSRSGNGFFTRYFIWKKSKKQILKKSRSGNGFFTVFSIFYLEKIKKTDFKKKPFGERLFHCFLDILFGKNQKNKL